MLSLGISNIDLYVFICIENYNKTCLNGHQHEENNMVLNNNINTVIIPKYNKYSQLNLDIKANCL